MTALANERDTIQYGRSSVPDLLAVPMKAATKVWKGSIVVADAGYAAPGRTATGLLALGRADETVDNTGAAGALKVNVRRGVFSFTNSSAGDLIAQTEMFATVYIVDDQTVAKTNGGSTRSAAGKLVGFDDDGNPLVQIG